jgi:hypothetical protein
LAIAELAFIGGTKGLNTTDERYAGLWGALVAAGLSVDAAPAEFVPARPAFGEEATKRLLRRKSRPTAPVLASSQLTVGASKRSASPHSRCRGTFRCRRVAMGLGFASGSRASRLWRCLPRMLPRHAGLLLFRRMRGNNTEAEDSRPPGRVALGR